MSVFAQSLKDQSVNSSSWVLFTSWNSCVVFNVSCVNFQLLIVATKTWYFWVRAHLELCFCFDRDSETLPAVFGLTTTSILSQNMIFSEHQPRIFFCLNLSKQRENEIWPLRNVKLGRFQSGRDDPLIYSDSCNIKILRGESSTIQRRPPYRVALWEM